MTTIVQQQQYPPPPPHHQHISPSQMMAGPSSLSPLPQPQPIQHTTPSTRPIANGQPHAPQQPPPPSAGPAPSSQRHPYDSPSQIPPQLSSPIMAPIKPPETATGKEITSEKQGDDALNPLTSSSSDRKRPHILMTDASVVPADDKNEWYYPAAPRPSASGATDDDEAELLPGCSTGNWGKKHVKGARWVRRGKLADWGPSRAEWEAEERSRKRLKTLLPPKATRHRSPPLPVLPHLRSPSPPLTAPYTLPPKAHTSYTSFILDHSVQHAYRNTTVQSLENTMTEFIEGEGALRMALGAFWRAMGSTSDLGTTRKSEVSSANGGPSEGDSSEKSLKHSVEPTLDDDLGGGDDDASMNGSSGAPTKTNEELLVASLSPLRQMFVSTSPVEVGPENAPHATLHTASQHESLEWGIGILRDLADDAREYMARLEEVREECGKARAVRKEVWRIVREKALGEMEEEERAQEGDEGEDEGVGSEY
ncbi:hypothetical protein FRB94_009247 [Tulasnella sp. JGI-2019a]|nr:hypothetical protein FRB94_009247 [Tulasnella sp. JGI-2019a]KAG9016504.1 hypothetical protein FRB93_010753 [Tulasnella sp. JGI-2019a]